MLIPYWGLNSSHSPELLGSQTDANSNLSDKSQLTPGNSTTWDEEAKGAVSLKIVFCGIWDNFLIDPHNDVTDISPYMKKYKSKPHWNLTAWKFPLVTTVVIMNVKIYEIEMLKKERSG